MTELDFDELDKAVSSIMSGVDTSKRKEGFDDPEDKLLEIPSSMDIPSSEPVVPPTTPVAVDAAVTPEAAASASEVKPTEPLAVKRRGQFMDVMHPSSDMKTMVAPRREGLTLRPSSPFVASQPLSTPEDEPMSTEPTVAPVVDILTPLDTEPATGGTQQEETPSESDEQTWPDPIEVAEKNDEIKDTDGDGMNDHSSIDKESVPDDVVEEVATPIVEQPITSPFLADAKVEKRPLGTAATFPQSVAMPETSIPPLVATPVQPLPEELKTDLLALESSNTAVEEKKPENVPEKAFEAGANTSNLPGSIPQQYTEQPSTGDVSNTSIYDTSTHHQPLEGSAQKSSPMKWIILGLVLLIVGALAGAAYFYFKTQ